MSLKIGNIGNKCENCSKSQVCKYKELKLALEKEMDDRNSETKEIFNPIRVEVTCREYDENRINTRYSTVRDTSITFKG